MRQATPPARPAAVPGPARRAKPDAVDHRKSPRWCGRAGRSAESAHLPGTSDPSTISCCGIVTPPRPTTAGLGGALGPSSVDASRPRGATATCRPCDGPPPSAASLRGGQGRSIAYRRASVRVGRAAAERRRAALPAVAALLPDGGDCRPAGPRCAAGGRAILGQACRAADERPARAAVSRPDGGIGPGVTAYPATAFGGASPYGFVSHPGWALSSYRCGPESWPPSGAKCAKRRPLRLRVPGPRPAFRSLDRRSRPIGAGPRRSPPGHRGGRARGRKPSDAEGPAERAEAGLENPCRNQKNQMPPGDGEGPLKGALIARACAPALGRRPLARNGFRPAGRV
jgi:hypothetical protein